MEIQILHWFESLHNPVTDPIMYGITCLGNAGILWILIALAFLSIPLFKKDRKIGLSIAIALILSLIMCNGIMKNLWARVRPFNVDTTFENLYGVFNGINDWSFPSGHTSASFAAALAIILWDRKKGTAAVIVAALISFSRLYLTVHYPTDVLTSLVFGSLYGIAGYFIAKLIMKKSERARRVFSEGESYKLLFSKAGEND